MEIHSTHTKIFLTQTQKFNKSSTKLMYIAVGLMSSGLELKNSHGQSPEVWKSLVRFLSWTWIWKNLDLRDKVTNVMTQVPVFWEPYGKPGVSKLWKYQDFAVLTGELA